MKHLFIPYELALIAKEKGFDEPCLGLYHKDGMFVVEKTESHNQYYGQICSAPLYQQIVDWFREKHNISIELHYQSGTDGWSYCYGHNTGNWYFPEDTHEYYISWTKAIEKVFKKVFKLI